MIKEAVRIEAMDVLDKIDAGEKFLLLDVRSREDHDSWPIRCVRPLQQMNIPYYDFMENQEDSIQKIPKDIPVFLVCNRGNASDEIAVILADRGLDARSIRDGMKSWGSVYRHNVIAQKGNQKIVQFNRIAKGCLSYVLISGDEAALIDPARHTQIYEKYLSENNLKLKYIFDTHLHADHISGAAELVEHQHADYMLHDGDGETSVIPHSSFKDGDRFRLGEETIFVVSLHSPGHTPGSTAFQYMDNHLFTGDMLFLTSVGRPDLGGQAEAWVGDLWTSIRRLDSFPDNTVILPTHHAGVGDFDHDRKVYAELGTLRKQNQMLSAASETDFRKEILGNLPEEPESYQKMRNVNLGLNHPDNEEMDELELGRNRCAVEAYKEKKAG